MVEVFGWSLGVVGVWYQNKKDIPEPYRMLIQTYIDNPQIFKKQMKNIIRSARVRIVV